MGTPKACGTCLACVRRREAEARAALLAVWVTEPDADGKRWIRVHLDDGRSAAIAIPAGGIIGETVTAWNTLREAALSPGAPGSTTPTKE